MTILIYISRVIIINFDGDETRLRLSFLLFCWRDCMLVIAVSGDWKENISHVAGPLKRDGWYDSKSTNSRTSLTFLPPPPPH